MWQHLVEEYARHNGHADLLREAIDGSAGCEPGRGVRWLPALMTAALAPG